MEGRAVTQATKRARLLAMVALAWVLVIAGRLLYLQVIRHQYYKDLSDNQSISRVEIPALRGSLLDRSGRPLALSLPADVVVVNPILAPEPAITSGILAPILGLERVELEIKLAAAARERRGFFPVKRKVGYEDAQRLRDLRLDWIQFRGDSLRAYPKGSLASHLVGGVDHLDKGNAGLEQSLDAELRGKPGLARLITDVTHRGVESRVDFEPIPGKNITLTIDERVQFVAERELAKAVQASHSQTGSVVAMNPATGEVLAMASYPSFDGSRPVASEQDLANRINQALSVPFEPGSVFKVITLSAALETTTLRPETIINCGGGQINLFGRIIHDAHPHGNLSMADVLALSSNIGAIQVGLKVGPRNFLEYIQRFGFGHTTGLPLPGESSGKVWDLKDWRKTSIGSVSMGHEISTTTVQLAQAVSAVANGGVLVKPRLILSRQRPGEPPAAEPPSPARRILLPETAITMRSLMEGVVLHGTGTQARLKGYTAGGKTGSAQIFDPACRCYKHLYNASFAGFAPVTNPAIVVVVTINGASVFGGAIAAPVFREVATAALRLLDVPKDVPDAAPARKEAPVVVADLALPAVADEPKRAPEIELWGPTVPDFSGKTLRAVAEESAALGLPVELMGSGVVRAQAPPAGSVLASGARVRIQFAR